MLYLLLALVACTPARRQIEGDIVRDVRFEGNGGPLSGHNDYQLLSQMQQEASSFGLMLWPLMYFVEPARLEHDALLRDAYRLEVWYAHNGWFDAEFKGWMIQRIREPGEHRAGIVDVRGAVVPGTPSLVRDFRIEGLEGAREVLGKTVVRTGDLQKGGQFSLAAATASRAQLLELLHDHAHAYATVEMSIDAYPPEHLVDVAFQANAGITTTIGEISISGQETVREEILRNALPIEPGDAYKLKSLRSTQGRLFDLGTFSLVEVEPDLSDPTAKAVPIHITVHESKPQTLRFGVGGDWYWNSADIKLTGGYQHANLFHELIRVKLDGSVGLAFAELSEDLVTDPEAIEEAPAPEEGLFESLRRHLEPTWDNGLSLEYPRIAGQRVSLLLAGSDTRQLQTGQFLFRRLEVDPGVAWRITDDIVLSAGPHWEQFAYLQDVGEEAETLFGEGFVNPYRLFTIQSGLIIDWRDDPASPHRGSYWSFNVAQGIPGVGSYNFLGLGGDARAYRPIRTKKMRDFPITIAGRLHGRIVQPWGDSSAPYPELAFLGGSNSLRGFLRDQVGPYRTVCTSAKNVYVPAGGKLMAGMNTELRYDWAYGVTFASFVDLGVLATDWADLAANGLERIRGGAGLGARYNTLVGPVRMDLAARPLFPEDLGPTGTSPACGELDSVPARFTDLLGLGHREDPSDRAPFALNLYITIGEAI